MRGLSTLVAGAAVATLVTAAPAHAQLRGMIKKKIAEKVVDKAVPEKDAPASVGNSKRATRYTPAVVGEELTAEVLDATIRGLRVEVATTARGDSLGNEISALLSRRASAEVEAEYRTKRERVEQCRSEFFPKLEQKYLEETERRIRKPSSPVSTIERWEEARMRYQQDLVAAMTRGDTAGIVKLRRSFWQSQGIAIDTKADTVASERECGSMPAKPPGVAARERADSLTALSRRLQEQYADSGAAASGLSATKYGLAKERLRTWWDDRNARKEASKGTHDKSTRENAAAAERFWSEREQTLLESRRTQLAPLVRKLFGLVEA